MRRLGPLMAVVVMLLCLFGCTLPGYETAESTTTTTTTTTLSIRDQKPFYDWTLSDMIVYLTEEGVITDESLLTVTPEETLADTGISGALTYATEDLAASLDIFFWDPQSTDEKVAQQRVDMIAGRPLTLGGMTLNGDRRVGNFLFLYGTSADTAFAGQVAAACDKLLAEE